MAFVCGRRSPPGRSCLNTGTAPLTRGSYYDTTVPLFGPSDTVEVLNVRGCVSVNQLFKDARLYTDCNEDSCLLTLN